MEDSQIRFDSERLDARLAKVTESLAGSIKDAEHLQRLATVGTVAGLIAHEFRNLMTPVKSYAQLALRRPDDAELTRKALEAAMAGAEQAAAIAESLLELTGVGGAPTGKASEWCHVEHAVDGVRAGLEDVLSERGVELIVELEPGVRAAMAQADLRQVLLNLVQNAAKSMDGGGTVWVRARSESGWSLSRDLEDGGVDGGGGVGESTWHIEGEWGGGEGRVVVEVCDCGGGIAAEKLGRVFEAFVSGGGGRGMGLATCCALVGKAGGRVGVVSGAGTRFVLELPCCKMQH